MRRRSNDSVGDALDYFNMGFSMANKVLGAREANAMKGDLSNASQANQATEAVTGDDATQAIGGVQGAQSAAQDSARADALLNTGDEAAADQAGLAAAQQYDPAIKDLQRRGEMQSPEYAVGKQSFASQAEAKAAAGSANTAGMSDVYRKYGKPEEALKLQRDALQTEATGLAVKGVKRDDAIADKEQPMRLANAQFKAEQLPRELEKKVIAGEIEFADAQRSLAKHFSASLDAGDPSLVNRWFENGTLAKAFPSVFKDATDIGRSGDKLTVSYKDGTAKAVPIAAIRQWGDGGKEPLKFETLKPGDTLVAVGQRSGKTTEVARGPEDNSKRDTAINANADDFNKSLISGKGTMASLDETMQPKVTAAGNAYLAAVGEYVDKFKTKPTISEDAKIRQAVANKFGFGLKTK